MEMSSTFFLFFFSCKMIEKKERERERERELWMRVWIPFHPTKQHSNLCCTARQWQLWDVYRITNPLPTTQNREKRASHFRPTFRQLHTDVCISISLTPPQENPFSITCYSLQHLPSHQPNTKPCMPGAAAAAAVRTSYTACFGSTLQVRPTSISWHR
ncbi:unnamed protein product [Musa banksii]